MVRKGLTGRARSSTFSPYFKGTLLILFLAPPVLFIGVMSLRGPTDIGSNQTAAIARLRNLSHCQEQYRRERHVDLDGDGAGEYGTLGELTAAAGVRRDPRGRERGPRLGLPILSPSFSGVDATGIVITVNYCFRVLLPGPAGRVVHEGIPGSPLSGTVDTDASEGKWCAYAWPNVFLENYPACNRVFFIDQSGEVWETANQDARYAGPEGGPGWGAALTLDGRSGWVPDRPMASGKDGRLEYTGRDGNVWRRSY